MKQKKANKFLFLFILLTLSGNVSAQISGQAYIYKMYKKAIDFITSPNVKEPTGEQCGTEEKIYGKAEFTDKDHDITYERELQFWKIIEKNDFDALDDWLDEAEELFEKTGDNILGKDHPYQRLSHLYSFACALGSAPVSPLGVPDPQMLNCKSKYYKYGGNLWGSTNSQVMKHMLDITDIKTIFGFGEDPQVYIDKIYEVGKDNVEGYVVAAFMYSIIADESDEGKKNIDKALEIMNNCDDPVCNEAPGVLAPSKPLGMKFALAEMLAMQDEKNTERSLEILDQLAIDVKDKNNAEAFLSEINGLKKEIKSGFTRMKFSIGAVKVPFPKFLRKNTCALCHTGASKAYEETYGDDHKKIIELREQ